MLESYSPQQSAFHEEHGQGFDFHYFIGIAKRRILYFIIPFLLIVLAGAAIIKSMPKVYHAEGEILVESPQIAPDLVHPTITNLAAQRFTVFKQHVMAADNLVAIADKFDLFPHDRASLSQSELLDLMRSRVQIKPVTLELQSITPTFAFSVAFDYEAPEVTLKVTNEILTEILNEDAGRRTASAAETTKVLEQEVNRLQGQHDAIVAQIQALKQQPPDQGQTVSDELQAQMKTLAALEADLVDKSSVYSDEYPVVKDLRKKIAALKHSIATGSGTPSNAPAASGDQSGKPALTTQFLLQQERDLAKNLDDANQKLTAARLGESLERNQQSEHLRVVSYPDLPDKPIRPNKLKFFGLVLAAAGAIGAGIVFAAEMLDGTIRRTSDLARIVDKHLVVAIPNLSTRADDWRRRRNLVLLFVVLIAATAAAIVGVMTLPSSVGLPGLN